MTRQNQTVTRKTQAEKVAFLESLVTAQGGIVLDPADFADLQDAYQGHNRAALRALYAGYDTPARHRFLYIAYRVLSVEDAHNVLSATAGAALHDEYTAEFEGWMNDANRRFAEERAQIEADRKATQAEAVRVMDAVAGLNALRYDLDCQRAENATLARENEMLRAKLDEARAEAAKNAEVLQALETLRAFLK